MSKITPFFWFDRNCEEAINYYVSIFNASPFKKTESKVVSIKRYPEGVKEGPMVGFDGKVLTAVFELEGQQFMGLDGGPIFKFTEAISLHVDCENQEEIDYFWEKLSADPASGQCGWTKDKFGLSWQIIPKNMEELISKPAALEAMLQMKKIVIADLEAAAK